MQTAIKFLKVAETFFKALVSAEGNGMTGYAKRQVAEVRERASFCRP